MKTYILTGLFAFIFSIALPTYSQIPSLTFGPELKPEKKEVVQLFGANDQYWYTQISRVALLNQKNANAECCILNKKDNSRKANIPLSCQPAGYDLGWSIFYTVREDKILVFTAHTKTGQKTEAVFLSKFDLNGKVVQPPTKIFEAVSNEDMGKKSEYTFDVEPSPNHQTFLISYPETVDKQNAQKYTFLAVNLDGKVLWKKSHTLEIPEMQVEAKYWEVSDEGVLYLLFKVKNAIFPKHETANYYYAVLVYDPTTDKVSEIKIELKSKFIDGIYIDLDQYNNLWCAGFYSDTKNGPLTNGVFYFKIDSITHQVVKSEMKAVADLYPVEIKNRDKWSYNVKSILFQENGDLILVGEQQYTYREAHTAGAISSYDPMHFVYNNVVVVCVQAGGGIKWVQKIAKRQDTKDDFGLASSVGIFMLGDMVHFLFNDHPKNLAVLWSHEKILDAEIQTYKSVLAMVSIDAKGKAIKQHFAKQTDGYFMLIPDDIGWINDNSLYIVSNGQQSYKFGTIKL